MATYTYTSDGLLNKETGIVTPFNRTAAPCLPRIDTSDDQEPLQSMADGKFYTSKAKMRESYKASGNPQGVEYAEVGNQKDYAKPKSMPKPDRTGIKDAVERAHADLNNGRFG